MTRTEVVFYWIVYVILAALMVFITATPSVREANRNDPQTTTVNPPAHVHYL